MHVQTAHKYSTGMDIKHGKNDIKYLLHGTNTFILQLLLFLSPELYEIKVRGKNFILLVSVIIVQIWNLTPLERLIITTIYKVHYKYILQARYIKLGSWDSHKHKTKVR